jgi:hypothetical protein
MRLKMAILVFCVVKPCGLVVKYQHFGAEDRGICSSETVFTYKSIRSHNPETATGN